MSNGPPLLHVDLLAQLESMREQEAVTFLTEKNLATDSVVAELVDAALERAEADVHLSARWLGVAAALNARNDGPLSLRARIWYARARIDLQRGDLQSAERSLRQAQDLWRTVGDQAALARSFLGLTQVLALQGRYAEAEQAIRRAIEGLPPDSVPVARAYRNLANLLTLQVRHDDALGAYEMARAILVAHATEDDDPALAAEIAHVDLNRANVLVALDRPDEAEEVYRSALARFDRSGDLLNRGRTLTNLGTLYLRTGRYAAALDALNQAEEDLLGQTPLLSQQMDAARLRQADIFLLDQANAYLALNLLPEAVTALERCQRLFRDAEQPYELAQSLYLLGVLRLRQGDFAAAAERLHEARAIFGDLGNPPWMHRTELALATLDVHLGETDAAHQRLATLLSALPTPAQPEPATGELNLAVEARLLCIQLALAADQLDQARRWAEESRSLLDQLSLPHLQLRLVHAQGQIEMAAGNPAAAQAHFYRAIDLLEAQRTSLPLEEFRTSYLADKFHLYTDLVTSLLSAPERDDQIVSAFAVVERARARSLLERMQAAFASSPEEAHDRQSAPQEPLRRRLHWLYNQLLGGDAGGDAGDATDPQQIHLELQRHERELDRLTWQMSHTARTALAQTQPVSLAAFQRSLRPDQQALIYYVAEPAQQPAHGSSSTGEVFLFLVERSQARVVRHLCAPAELAAAQQEMRFQMGRAELGSDYLARHGHRLTQALQRALHRLYSLLIAPIAEQLTAKQLLLIPHGALHFVPFHALWDGERYLLERFTCAYAPSATIAAQGAKRRGRAGVYRSFAGLAIEDPLIPQAQREVTSVAVYFPQAQLYLEDDANRQGLRAAAANADVLHIATHGLFRPDNPFYSSLKLADEWIDVRSLYQLPLAARLVVLSACESGSGEIRGGDEVVGLARGFLGAGAESLLVSLWNVHDQSVVHLMDNFYAHLTDGCAPAEALRRAQRVAIRQGQHPYFWASFLAIGS